RTASTGSGRGGSCSGWLGNPRRAGLRERPEYEALGASPGAYATGLALRYFSATGIAPRTAPRLNISGAARYHTEGELYRESWVSKNRSGRHGHLRAQADTTHDARAPGSVAGSRGLGSGRSLRARPGGERGRSPGVPGPAHDAERRANLLAG